MCENTDSRCTTTLCKPRDPLSTSGLSRFLLPTFLCGMQRKVGAAPHRGNTNRPLTMQGKAKTPRTLTMPPPKAKTAKKTQAPEGPIMSNALAVLPKNARSASQSKPRTTRRRDASQRAIAHPRTRGQRQNPHPLHADLLAYPPRTGDDCHDPARAP